MLKAQKQPIFVTALAWLCGLIILAEGIKRLLLTVEELLFVLVQWAVYASEALKGMGAVLTLLRLGANLLCAVFLVGMAIALFFLKTKGGRYFYFAGGILFFLSCGSAVLFSALISVENLIKHHVVINWDFFMQYGLWKNAFLILMDIVIAVIFLVLLLTAETNAFKWLAPTLGVVCGVMLLGNALLDIFTAFEVVKSYIVHFEYLVENSLNVVRIIHNCIHNAFTITLPIFAFGIAGGTAILGFVRRKKDR